MQDFFFTLTHISALRLCRQKIDNFELDSPKDAFDLKIDSATEDILLTYLSAIVLHTMPPTFDTDECEKLIQRVYQLGYHVGQQSQKTTTN